MPVAHTIRPGAARWRLGQDDRRHAVNVHTVPPRGVCGIRLRDERFDNPERDRCTDCLTKLPRALL